MCINLPGYRYSAMRISINQFLLGPCSIFPFFFLFLQILEMGLKHLVHLDHTRGEQQGGDKNGRGDLLYSTTWSGWRKSVHHSGRQKTNTFQQSTLMKLLRLKGQCHEKRAWACDYGVGSLASNYSKCREGASHFSASFFKQSNNTNCKQIILYVEVKSKGGNTLLCGNQPPF